MASLSISAIVVSHVSGDYLERSLSALSKQQYPIEQVVVVDTAGDEQTLELARRYNFAAIQPGDIKFGAAVSAGIAALQSRPNWLWILHDDSAPEPDALRHLARAAEISPSVAVIGPKLLDWDNPIEIQQMGLTVTKTGRPFLLVEREYDQGQHDASSDALAVSTAGMLVSLGLWEKLGGIDDRSPVFAQDVEFGIRTRAAGFRVIVEAAARVHHAGLSMAGKRSRKWLGGSRKVALSRAHLHLATTVLPIPLAAALYLVLPLFVAAMVPINLLGKNPGRSLGQLLGWLWAWTTFPARFAARIRTRQLGQLSSLASLYASAEQRKRRRRNELALEVEPKVPVPKFFTSGAVLFALLPLLLAIPRFPQGAIFSDQLVPIGRSFAAIWENTAAATLQYQDGVGEAAEPFNWFFALLGLIWPAGPSLALATFVFIAPALVFAGVWSLLSAVTEKSWLRTSLALLVALSPQVQLLAGAAAVAELAALIGFIFASYFLLRSTTAFNAARAWRWMALAGFAAAMVAVASPVAFALLLLVAMWVGALRPARLAISLWFLVPGIALLLPWLSQLTIESLVTSSARVQLPAPELLEWIMLGILGLIVAIGFAIGRPLVLSGVLVFSALLLLSTRVEPLASFAELRPLLVLALAVGVAEVLSRLGKRSVNAAASILAAAATAAGVFYSALAPVQFQFGAERQMPALVVALADVEPGTRTLLIELGDQVTADLVWGDGRSQDEISLRYRSGQNEQFERVLAQLTGSLLAGNPDGVPELLRATSIDFVLLGGDSAQLSAARVAVSSTALFQESGESEFGQLFRVLESNTGSVSISHPNRQQQLGVLAIFLLLSLPTPATILGYRRVRRGA